jgi:transposase
MTKKPSLAVSDAVPATQVRRERTVFSRQFKLTAVERMQEPGCSPAALALELGIRRNQLYKWAAALKQAGELPAPKVVTPVSTTDLAKENARLKRALQASLEENAILKKLDAYLTRR